MQAPSVLQETKSGIENMTNSHHQLQHFQDLTNKMLNFITPQNNQHRLAKTVNLFAQK